MHLEEEKLILMNIYDDYHTRNKRENNKPPPPNDKKPVSYTSNMNQIPNQDNKISVNSTIKPFNINLLQLKLSEFVHLLTRVSHRMGSKYK